MCMKKTLLTKVNSKGMASPGGKFYGYKAYRSEPNGILHADRGDIKLELGKWMKADGDRIFDDTEKSDGELGQYAAGFHIWLNQFDAKNYYDDYQDIFRVEFRNIVALGTNKNKNEVSRPCVVAREMRLIEKVN
jgi:hypothetical protein